MQYLIICLSSTDILITKFQSVYILKKRFKTQTSIKFNLYIVFKGFGRIFILLSLALKKKQSVNWQKKPCKVIGLVFKI